ncbi:PilZ domain-containing protein [Aurantiacibacter flavus]|uniref:PilZ domain-containing protein n=1 Tax=Aurantiacibacter flavus TaxID=3145232 RepID=A0ABV0CZA9_9SPHN
MPLHRPPLNAEVLLDQRGSARRTVRFATPVDSAADKTRARIHDLSESGLRLETAVGFDLGETLLVELPFVGETVARVVWNERNSYGCEFSAPVGKAAVSAALLRSRKSPSRKSSEGAIKEHDIGIDPSLEQIAAWTVEFGNAKDADEGYRLIGFRMSEEGIVKALVTKNY